MLSDSVKPRRNIDCLDAFRGVAIVMVFVFHYSLEVFGVGRHLNEWNGNWRAFRLTANDAVNAVAYPITFGWAGVSLFFVLSGFVIHYSFQLGSGQTWRNYFRRRFWRIYPPYLIALATFAASTEVVRSGVFKIDWPQFLSHAFLVHNFSTWSFYGINPSFWSLAVECQFYLMYPLVYLGFRRLGPAWTLALTAALSATLRIAVWFFYGPVDFDSPWWLNPISLWFDWVLGAYLAERFLSGRRVFSRPILAVCVTGTAFAASTLYFPTSAFSFSLASIFAAAVIDFRLHVVPWAAWRWVERRLAPIGLISYSLYLYHQPLIDYLLLPWRAQAAPRFQPVGLLGLLALPIIFLLIAAASYVLYRVVEISCIRIGRGGKPVRTPEAPVRPQNAPLADIGSGSSEGTA